MANSDKTGAGTLAPLSLRELKSKDVFTFVRILKKVDITQLRDSLSPELIQALDYKQPMTRNEKGEIVPLPESEWTDNQRKAYEKAGSAFIEFLPNLIDFLLSNIELIEDDIYKLLSDGTGATLDQLYELPAVEFVQLIYDYVSRDNFRDFFSDALELVGSIMTDRNS